jgi:hypothetical protein
MSLPPAKKDISENPTKGSVVAPVDKVEKDKDIDRKVSLCDAYTHELLFYPIH